MATPLTKHSPAGGAPPTSSAAGGQWAGLSASDLAVLGQEERVAAELSSAVSSRKSSAAHTAVITGRDTALQVGPHPPGPVRLLIAELLLPVLALLQTYSSSLSLLTVCVYVCVSWYSALLNLTRL